MAWCEKGQRFGLLQPCSTKDAVAERFACERRRTEVKSEMKGSEGALVQLGKGKDEVELGRTNKKEIIVHCLYIMEAQLHANHIRRTMQENSTQVGEEDPH